MKKSIFLFAIIFIIGCMNSYAQDTISKYNGKALNIPFRKYGISFGNSYVFNGIRFNISDDEYGERVNGINITFWMPKKGPGPKAVVNGIGMGLISFDRIIQPLSLAVLLLAADNLNGISMCGLLTYASKINGINISGLATIADKNINGIAFGGLGIGTTKLSGLAVTPIYMESVIYNGVAIAGYAKTTEMHGLSFAIINKSTELHGIQFGLWNVAENNPKGLRKLPLMNMHLGAKQKDQQ